MDFNRRPDEEGIKTGEDDGVASSLLDFNRRPDEEGIKTARSVSLVSPQSDFNRRPDEEGIKTRPTHAGHRDRAFQPQT